jgi:hypothetical protein
VIALNTFGSIADEFNYKVKDKAASLVSMAGINNLISFFTNGQDQSIQKHSQT